MEKKIEPPEETKKKPEDNPDDEIAIFIRKIIPAKFAEEVIKILEEQHLTTVESLKDFSQDDMKEWGLKIGDIKKIFKVLQDLAPKTETQKSFSALNQNGVDNISPKSEHRSPKEPTCEIPSETKSHEEKEEIKTEYILKTDNMENVENLMKQLDCSKYLIIDDKVYISFSNIEDRDKCFEKISSIKILDHIELLKKGVFLKLCLKKQVLEFLSKKKNELEAVCSRYKANIIMSNDIIKQGCILIFTDDSQFSKLSAELYKKFVGLKLLTFTYHLIKKKAGFKSSIFDLVLKNAARIAALNKCMIELPNKTSGLFWKFTIAGFEWIFKVKNWINRLIPDDVSKDIEIILPIENDSVSNSENKSDTYDSDSRSSDEEIFPIQDGSVSNSENKSDTYDIDSGSSDKEIKKANLSSKSEYKFKSDYREKYLSHIKNNISEIIKKIEGDYNVIMDYDVVISSKGASQKYVVKVKSIGFDKSTINNSIKELESELLYKETIDFTKENENFLKGAYLFNRKNALHRYALSLGTLLFVNFNSKSKPAKSNVKLRGLRKNVQKVIEYLNELLKNFKEYKFELNRQIKKLQTHDNFENKKYHQYLKRYCFSIINGYRESEFKNEAVEFQIIVSTTYQIILTINFGTTDEKDEKILKAGFKAVFEDLTFVTVPNQKDLMSKIDDRKFIFKDFMRKYKVGFVKDNMDCVLIGRKNDVELGKNYILNQDVHKEVLELKVLHKTFLRKRIAPKLDEIASSIGIEINMGAYGNNVNIIGPKLKVQEALEKVKLAEKNIMNSTISESLKFDDSDFQVLKNNSKKIDEWSEKYDTNIELIDHSVIITKAKSTLSSNKIKISVKEGNILDDKKVDVIVNCANAQLDHRAGVAFDIACAAGEEFIKESKKIATSKNLMDGDVIEAKAGKLPYKYIFNAIVPIWKEGNSKCELALKRTVKNILHAANNLGVSSLAMPCLCAGCFGCPQSVSASIILNELINFTSNVYIKEIHFIDINHGAVEEFTSLLKAPDKIKDVLTEEAKKICDWKAEYEWYWDHYEIGKKEKYDPDQNWNIEYSYQKFLKKEVKEALIIGDLMKIRNSKNYVVLFEEMKQMNIETKYKRDVFRMPIDKTSMTRLPKKSEIISKDYIDIANNLFINTEDLEKEVEMENEENKKVCTCIITGSSSLAVSNTKNFLYSILEENKMTEELKIEISLSKPEAEEILKIIRNCNCQATLVNRGKSLQIKGYQLNKEIAKAKLWKFIGNLRNIDIPVPETWTPQETYIELVKLEKSNSEFIAASKRFYETMPPTAKITNIQRIQNTLLWKSYSIEIQKLKSIRGYEPCLRDLFHGTRTTSPAKIYSGKLESFDFRFSKEGCAWGRGAYFAENASYSHSYNYKTDNSEFQIFIANVIIGDYVELPADNNLTVPPLKPGSTDDSYDSVRGVSFSSVIYIVYSHVRAYPKYLITYK